jgi:hypothetical protein
MKELDFIQLEDRKKVLGWIEEYGIGCDKA